jgi:serine/threonine-protein kinase RIM15
MGEVKFDAILMDTKLPQINGSDAARMIRETKNVNAHTPIVAVSSAIKTLEELGTSHHFNALAGKPVLLSELSEILSRLCQWKPAPPNWTPFRDMSSSTQQFESKDSPPLNSSSIPHMPSGSHRDFNWEDISLSNYLGDSQGRRGEDVTYICDCCPKKPKRFKTEEELR